MSQRDDENRRDAGLRGERRTEPGDEERRAFQGRHRPGPGHEGDYRDGRAGERYAGEGEAGDYYTRRGSSRDARYGAYPDDLWRDGPGAGSAAYDRQTGSGYGRGYGGGYAGPYREDERPGPGEGASRPYGAGLPQGAAHDYRHTGRGRQGYDAQSGYRSDSREPDYGGYGLAPGRPGHRYDEFEPDYHQWRNEQLRLLDEDYLKFREERYKRFADEFNEWRGSRALRAPAAGEITRGVPNGSPGASDPSPGASNPTPDRGAPKAGTE